jgi:hypothetical protein
MRRRSPKALAAWRRAAIGRMTRSRATTLGVVARLPREALERPGTRDAWAPRDVLAHIAAWEEEGTRRLALIARGRGDRIVWYETAAEMDRFNARAVRQGRRLSVPRLLARLARARAGLIRALRRLPLPALADPAHDVPVTTWMREFAWTHEQGHRAELRAGRGAH